MSPAEVFQRDYMTLTCQSESYASERIKREELTYTLEPPDSPLTPKKPGVFSGSALQFDFNYTCVARARGITKPSETLTVRPKGKLTRCLVQMSTFNKQIKSRFDIHLITQICHQFYMLVSCLPM